MQAEWLAFGAANDWFPVETNSLSSPGKWSFPLGTSSVSRLAVFSSGTARPRIKDSATFVSPLSTSIGIVPSSRHSLLAEGDRPSLFWHRLTPDNSLVLTWQNVLLGRDASSPVSFQAELFESGDAVFRYDLGRLAVPVVSNVVVGASADGVGSVLAQLPTNVTSLTWRRVDPEDADDPDRDGDGISTEDELFVYGTDPHSADTDNDGLSDYDELFVHDTDPLDPNSVSAVYSDGLAVKIGDLDPFSCPSGSTNTVLEHVFYSGTTNGAFAYPQSSDDMAVLRVSVSGSGSGDLVVGNQVVPLVAPPQMRSSPPSPAPPLLVPVAKGVVHPLRLRDDGTLSVSLGSDDFAFGELPSLASGRRIGWLDFPSSKATEPCIHDYNARRKTVSLPAGADAAELVCMWQGGGNVEVENNPPRTATITGNFSARGTSGVTYTLSHPKALFGPKSYAQTVRFCPRPPDPDPEEPDPPWYSDGDGDDSGENDDDHDEHWCCFWGTCDEWCACGCDCWQTSPEVGDEEDFDEECPEHSMPYEDCAYLHEADYTNAVQNVQHLGGVLYIRDPPIYEQIHLDVPTEHVNCCPCPDHWTNYVGVAYKSYRLRLVDSDGLPFSKAGTSCDVSLAGIYPSSAVGDATLAFSRNGEIYQRHDKTVLGVAIRGQDGVDLADYNALSGDFGYPMTVCTNLLEAPSMSLATNVRLPNGNVHLELADATGQFALWYYDNTTWDYRRLLDTATCPVKDLSMAYWKVLMRRASYGDTSELPIRITSSAIGTVSLVFRYWNVIDGKFVEDQAVQRITSVNPPLLADADGDWHLGDGDVAAQLAGRPFRFWTNEDCHKGDYVGQSSDIAPNASDYVVNGGLDLVNLFPVKLDLKPFVDAWGSAARFVLWSPQSGIFRFCGLDAQPDSAWEYQTNDVYTTTGDPVCAADLIPVGGEGVEIAPADYLGLGNAPGVLAFEAADEVLHLYSLTLFVIVGDDTLFSYSLPMSVRSVHDMYSWIGARHLSGEAEYRNTVVNRMWEGEAVKSLMFLHGANVSGAAAQEWGDAVFKRLWLSGAKIEFYNVDWRSNIGGPANYHENASNAFVVASQLAPVLSNIPGEKVIMAHSLGNMVVSSMIQDYGLQVSKYLMCNSAVPAEAYDTTLSPTNVLVHKDWNEYPRKTFANEWYKCFEEDVGDDRQLLTWGGRFSDVVDYAVNFYSTSDHVLELERNNNVWASDGYENWQQKYERYSWHKQELWKGRKGLIFNMGTTDWAGWSIREDMVGQNAIQPTNAWLMSKAELKTNTVFKLQPESMNMSVIPLMLRGAHLAKGIPSRTPASGSMKWGPPNMSTRMWNLDSTIEEQNGVSRPNGWPVRTFGWLITTTWETEWLHSDVKDVPYFYVFKFFERLKEAGGLE